MHLAAQTTPAVQTTPAAPMSRLDRPMSRGRSIRLARPRTVKSADECGRGLSGIPTCWSVS